MLKRFSASIAGRRFIRGMMAMSAFVMVADGSVAYAEPHPLPAPEQIALPGEREVLNNLLNDSILDEDSDPKAVLKILDEALIKLSQPTRMRGFVQFIRAQSLFAQNDTAKATTAIEESIRLLPGYSGPLIAAATIYAYSDQPGRGADYLLRASTEDPDTVRTIADYEIDNLLLRLRVAKEDSRLRALSNRLIEIDWTGSTLGSGSSLAEDVIKLRLNDGDVAGARALIPRLIDPRHFYGLLMDKAAQPIWPDIEAWAGPKLERQWPIYLNEARNRWLASKNSTTLADYLGALLLAGHDDTVIRQILPLFNDADKLADYDLVFAVPKVAGSLARQGRWQDVEALFERAGKIWKLGEEANALNVAANRGLYRVRAGKFDDGLIQIDAAIADTRRWGSQVNPDAVSAMHHYRACALHALRRDAEAGVSVALAKHNESATSTAFLHLCMGDADAARRALIAGLRMESDRQGVLEFVQIPERGVEASDYSRSLKAKADTLRKDRTLLAEVAKYGRVLPYSIRDGAPLESSAQ